MNVIKAPKPIFLSNDHCIHVSFFLLVFKIYCFSIFLELVPNTVTFLLIIFPFLKLLIILLPTFKYLSFKPVVSLRPLILTIAAQYEEVGQNIFTHYRNTINDLRHKLLQSPYCKVFNSNTEYYTLLQINFCNWFW